MSEASLLISGYERSEFIDLVYFLHTWQVN